MDGLDPYEFEQFVANLWEAKGYQTEVTSGSKDRGIDFEAHKLGRKEVVQVKKYGQNNKIGSQEVRKYATLYQQVSDADSVVLVTSGLFTSDARELADDLNVEIFNGDELAQEIREYNIATDFEISHTNADYEYKGVVVFFNDVGDYGMIAAEGVDDDVFFHMSEIEVGNLSEGNKVGLDVESDPKGPQARNVVRLDDSITVDVEKNRENSGCFIATAAYGTSTAKEIDILRDVRDKKLRGNFLGELFIDLYYLLSPPIAKNIKRSDRKQRLVQKFLVQPLVDTVRVFTRSR